MQTCQSCNATMAAGAAWCGQCYAAVPVSAGVGTRVATTFVTRPVPVSAGLPPPIVRSRWRKTQTTFGPVGRVVATVLLVIPFFVMLVGGLVGDFFALGGAGIWLVIIMPWGLRDVWKAGQVPSTY